MDIYCLACPICNKPLDKFSNVCMCEAGHSFDISKHGYVNLLPPMKKSSHGDNKEMIRARRDFLDTGHYQKLRAALTQSVSSDCKRSHALLLDAGCGEGYYTKAVSDALCCKVVGVDISKYALIGASKRLNGACLAAGSIYHLPVLAKKFDIALNIFAPFDKAQYLRALKDDGRLCMVIPGEDHLFELKATLYKNPYKNKPAPFEIEGFKLLSKERVTYEMDINSNQDLMNLFKMTPYYYRTDPEKKNMLSQIPSLKITADFIILQYTVAQNSQA